jgi:hypothetical protein
VSEPVKSFDILAPVDGVDPVMGYPLGHAPPDIGYPAMGLDKHGDCEIVGVAQGALMCRLVDEDRARFDRLSAALERQHAYATQGVIIPLAHRQHP